MTRYNVRIIPRENDEAITYNDIDAEKVEELRAGLPSDNFSFTVYTISEVVEGSLIPEKTKKVK